MAQQLPISTRKHGIKLEKQKNDVFSPFLSVENYTFSPSFFPHKTFRSKQNGS